VVRAIKNLKGIGNIRDIHPQAQSSSALPE
jgi:hypothetical protein